MSTWPTNSDFRRNFTPPGFNDRHQVAYGGNGGNTSIGINPSFDATYLQRRNFNAPAALIRRHQPPQRSFTYEAAVRSANSSSMNGSGRQRNNATPRFPLHQARLANQSFHLRNNYRPPHEIPPTNQNNYLIRYEIPPAQQDSDARRNEVPPYFRNGVDSELTPQDYQATRAREISYDVMHQVDAAVENVRRSSSRNEKRMD
ncbi:hypothetical protein Sjap_002408 [Stephania japonica]|uniref:Uncharacterized protein n=1 Tax=Stephania japonica TaxID=461633 RepID=A0AAP0PSH9_9MAGN